MTGQANIQVMCIHFIFKEWKIIYVGSAESEEFDQVKKLFDFLINFHLGFDRIVSTLKVLDTVYVGPVPEGRHKFVFTADSPNPEKIPTSDVVGVTVILLTCSYRYRFRGKTFKFIV